MGSHSTTSFASRLLVAFALLGSGCEGGPTQAPVAGSARVQIEGSQDATTCTVIEGWAYDPAAPDRRLSVQILEGETVVAIAEASNPRPDLVQSGIGDGKHSFSIPTPSVFKDGKPHVVRVREASTGTVLNKGPKTITCSP